jgi:hypothetical protein
MKRLMACCIGLALAAATHMPAQAATNIRVGIDIGSAPPAPRIYFESRPRFAYVPAQRVYVIEDDYFDYDMFRYGNYYYVYNDGWWYRSRGYRGPFVVVQTRYVPRAIFSVDQRHYRWRHHPHGMPPGQAKKHRGGRGW